MNTYTKKRYDHETVCAVVDAFSALVREIADTDEKHQIKSGVPFVDAVLDCDHNMVMIRACRSVLGREPYFPSDVEVGNCTEREMLKDHALLESAWEICEDNRYFL